MKKNVCIILTFCLLFFLNSKAQITITTANMPASGDTIRYSTCKPSTVGYSLTGANVFWNYDSLVPTGQGLYNYQSALSTPYFFYFTGGDFGLKIADSIGTATFKLKNVYDFYKNTAANFTIKGTGFQYSGIPLAANYTTPDQVYVFPLSYLNHDSTPYKVITSITTTTLSFTYAQYGYRITDVDGWGVIKTPFDSVPCIRVVSTTYGKDSINYNGFPFTVPDVQRSYKWLSLTEKIPVLELDGTYTNNTFAPNAAKYRDGIRYFAGINEVQATPSKILVYPNPGAGDLYICSNTNELESLQIYDLNGSLVATYKVKGVFTSISTRTLSSGSYFYKALDKQSRVLSGGKLILIN